MFYLAEDLSDEFITEAFENPTFIERLIASFEWRIIAQKVVIASFRMLFSLIIFYLLHRIAKWGIDVIFQRYLQSRSKDLNRHETVYRVVMNVYWTIYWFFLAYTILDILKFPVGTLLASAGIVGLTISFGAQGFVSDLVNGFTILSGKQLNIGDEVKIEDISGIVMNMNLRTTEIKDFDGTIHYIPNREILIISNRSKGDMRARIDVRLFPDVNTEEVRDLIRQVNEKLVPLFPNITVPPTDILFVSNNKNQLTLRVVMRTKPGSQYEVQNKFYEAYVQHLTDSAIDLPYGDINLDRT